jgi:hypothetical protein
MASSHVPLFLATFLFFDLFGHVFDWCGFRLADGERQSLSPVTESSCSSILTAAQNSVARGFLNA